MKFKKKFDHFIDCHVRRVLTHLDRDPDSPTFGCFDRAFWHYKARDYSSAILQQSVLVLNAIRKKDIDFSVSQLQIENLCQAAVSSLTKQINQRGGVNEYYPWEHSYVAGAFSLLSVSRVLLDWQIEEPRLLNGVDWSALQRQVTHIANHREHRDLSGGKTSLTTPSCQFAAALAALYLANDLNPIHVNPDILTNNLEWLLKEQHEEGWFSEYGGPDFGYLSVTIDALADIHRITNNTRVWEAMIRSIVFVAKCIGPDRQLPFELGCRNTEYFYSYGIVYAAQRDPIASWLVETIYYNIDNPEHFLWAVDDRYLCHCTMASFVRSLPLLETMRTAEAPRLDSEEWLPGCGYWIMRAETWTAFIAAKKGGIFRIARRSETPLLDYGWRVDSEGRQWTNNWWSNEWDIHKINNCLTLGGNCQLVSYELPTTIRHACLRIFAWFFRDRIKPFIKQILILRNNKRKGPLFRRLIKFDSGTLKIDDTFISQGSLSLKSGPRQNLRYVPSANSFLDEERHPPLFAEHEQEGSDQISKQLTINLPSSNYVK